LSAAILKALTDLKREIVRNRSVITSHVSHEMKTPLTAVLGRLRPLKGTTTALRPTSHTRCSEMLGNRLRNLIASSEEWSRWRRQTERKELYSGSAALASSDA
jgi:signal transduction histidine kinase